MAAFEDEPVASAAPPDEPDVLEAPAPADVAPSEELAAAEFDAVAIVDISDAPIAAPADVVVSEELAAAGESDAAIDAAAAPAPEQAELPDAAMPDTPIQDFSADNDRDQTTALPDVPAMPDGSAPAVAAGTAQMAHPPQSSNGTAHTPKSGRGLRRQPPAAEPAVKQPAKRRSGGSKRKQTT